VRERRDREGERERERERKGGGGEGEDEVHVSFDCTEKVVGEVCICVLHSHHVSNSSNSYDVENVLWMFVTLQSHSGQYGVCRDGDRTTAL
jgi:hypothetical protein